MGVHSPVWQFAGDAHARARAAKAALLRIVPRGVAVGIGAIGSEPTVEVRVPHGRPDLANRLPRTLDGVRVRVVVLDGPIRSRVMR